MAQRLSFDERARVEAMSAAGVSVAGTARRLGRHRSTVYRELGRNRDRGGYDAQVAQVAADRRARRPKRPWRGPPAVVSVTGGGLAKTPDIRWQPPP